MLLEDYRNERLRKLEEIRARGIDPYPAKSTRNTKISDIIDNFDEKDGEARPADMPKVEIRPTTSAITGWEEQVIPTKRM